jgi:hypothetical protein
MRQQIVSFHLDDPNDWVADLDCGHGQHCRRNPPWINRSWVLTEEGRQAQIGQSLECKKCDQPDDEM